MGRLLNFFKGKSPTPKPVYDTRMEMVYSYELQLLRLAAWEKGEREGALKKLKTFTAWRLANPAEHHERQKDGVDKNTY